MGVRGPVLVLLGRSSPGPAPQACGCCAHAQQAQRLTPAAAPLRDHTVAPPARDAGGREDTVALPARDAGGREDTVALPADAGRPGGHRRPARGRTDQRQGGARMRSTLTIRVAAAATAAVAQPAVAPARRSWASTTPRDHHDRARGPRHRCHDRRTCPRRRCPGLLGHG